MPLYARKFSRGSWGDSEQFYEPVYEESDSNGDGIGDTATGIASWLECFALGGIGKKRSQMHPCCFSTNVFLTYESFVKRKVASIGSGQWSLYSDRSHNKHIISHAALKEFVKQLKL